MTFRRWILRNSRDFVQWLGHVHAPFSRSMLTSRDCQALTGITSIGDVLLSKSTGEASNIVIGGHFKHAAMITESCRFVVEAVSGGVREVDLVSWLLDKDEVLVLRPICGSFSHRVRAVEWAKRQVGVRYDWDFTGSDRAFYCVELVADALHHGTFGNLKCIGREVLGEKTYFPDGLARDSLNFEKVYLTEKSRFPR
jgi:hypothetical protein